MTESAVRSLLCPTLVGRAREVTAVREVVDQRAGAHVVGIVGDAGVGKSALTRTGLADSNRTVLSGRATPDGVELRVLAEIAIAAVVAGAQVDDPTLEALRGGLAPLLPGSATADLADATFPFVTAEALLALIATLDHPATLVLEDLHWADGDTLEAIERICDRVAARSVTVVLVTRPQSAAEQLVHRLGSRRAATVIDLQPLDSARIVEMASTCLGGPAPAGMVELLAAAGGVPYLVEELLRTASDVGALTATEEGWAFDPTTSIPPPATLAESVAMRLGHLPASTARALCIAAALGEGQPVEAVSAAAGVDDPIVMSEVVRVGIEAQLLDATSIDIRFRHALSADAAAALLLPRERREAAASALAALTADPDALARVEPGSMAALAERAGQDDVAARWRLEAGRRHAARAATTSAVAELDRALRLAREPTLVSEIRVDYVELLALAGRESDALAQADVVAAGPQLSMEESIRVDLARARCATAGTARQQAIDRALTHAGGTPLEPKVAATAALFAVESGDHAAASRHAAVALTLGDADPTTRCQALEVLGRVARGNDLDDAHRLFTQAAAVAEASGLALWRASALHERATIAQLRDGDVTELHAARGAAIDAAAPGLIATIDFHLAAVLATRFEGLESLDIARRFIELSSALGNRAGEAWGWILVGQAHVVSGHWHNASAALDAAARLRPDDPEIRILSTFFRDGLARLLRADLPGATDGYLRAMADLDAASPVLSPLPPWYLGPLLATANAAESTGIRGEGDRPELRVASVCHGPWLMAEAVAAGRSGDSAGANHYVALAGALWDDKPGLAAHRHLARWLAAPSAHRDGWGSPQVWLFDSEAWAVTMGLSEVAEACRAELRAIGATPKRRRGTTMVPEELRRLGVTSREVDVLRLLAEGLTNAAIAEQLHISAGTVKGYVSQLLTKTGAGNRAGLARMAADRVGVDPHH